MSTSCSRKPDRSKEKFARRRILGAAASWLPLFRLAIPLANPCGDPELAATAAVLARRIPSMVFSIAGLFPALALVRRFTSTAWASVKHAWHLSRLSLHPLAGQT